VAAMAEKYFEGNVDNIAFDASAKDQACDEAFARYDFRSYVDTVWSVVAEANEKVDKEAPFKTFKTDPTQTRKTLSELASMIRWIGVRMTPVMPTIGVEITRRYAGTRLEVGPVLFPKE
jgi:methionyl-tRNA synthetase